MCANQNHIIGILALQGAFREHCQAFKRLGVETREIRLPDHLTGIAGLVIPGGESTAIGKLLVTWKLIEPVRQLGEDGLPIWGTCAGAIMLAKRVIERGKKIDQPLLELLDMTAIRNAFGRQRESFEADIPITGIKRDYRAVFIRAPLMKPDNDEMEILASVEDEAVFVRHKNIMATSFHPELTDDDRIHSCFLNLIKSVNQ